MLRARTRKESRTPTDRSFSFSHHARIATRFPSPYDKLLVKMSHERSQPILLSPQPMSLQASGGPSPTPPAAGLATSPRSASKLAALAARMPESSVNSACGALAGIASGIVTCPLDVIKTRLQAQGGFRPRVVSTPGVTRPVTAYKGLIPTAQLIWRQDGLRGMYRGLGPMLVGYLPTWSVYMTVYGSARESYYEKLGNIF